MISALKPYKEYKATAKDWFGVVPKHWSILPNRALFFEVKDRHHPDEEMLSVTIKRGVVRQKTLLADSSKKDSSNLNKSAYKLVQPDDLAYNKMRTWQGAIGVSEFRGIISPAYIVMRLRNKENVPRYFHYLYRTPQFAKEAERWSYGITSDMWSLRPEHFKVIYTPQPSREEQIFIIRFLNWANGRLERAIRTKRKVIALLNEQKQAIIHRAVTRGLDPSVPLKSSGIPWLGEIPKHWDVRPLKQLLVRMDYGTSANTRGEGRVRVLNMGHLQDGTVRIPEKGSLSFVPLGLLLEKNDLLFNRTNSAALVGKVGLFEGDATDEVTFASYLVRLRLHVENNPYWLNYLLNSTAFWSYAKSQALVSLHQANLNARRYGQMILPVPPTRSEQDKIVAHINLRVDKLNYSIVCLEHEIDCLREYRTRLVADVVTGKLDVREVAVKLPEEEMPEEMETSSEDEISDEEIAV